MAGCQINSSREAFVFSTAFVGCLGFALVGGESVLNLHAQFGVTLVKTARCAVKIFDTCESRLVVTFHQRHSTAQSYHERVLVRVSNMRKHTFLSAQLGKGAHSPCCAL